MSSQTILKEVQNFLQQYPPFEQMTPMEISRIAEKSTLKYYAKEECLFQQGEQPLPRFFMVKRGNIEIQQEQDGKKVLVDVCDEGDIFGIRAGFAEGNYIASAKAVEEALLYLIPLDIFKEIMLQNSKVNQFITAGFASGISIFRPEDIDNPKQVASTLSFQNLYQENLIGSETIEINQNREVVTGNPEMNLQEVALLMREQGIGSLIITNAEKQPIGIITDSDFRKKVVSNALDVRSTKVKDLMSSPVITVRPNITLSELTLEMVSHKITHLCVTEDGSPYSKTVGVVSQRDVLSAQGDNPTILVKEMLKTSDVARLSKLRDQAEKLIESYLNQEIGIPFISRIITEINDVLIQKAVEMAQEKLKMEGLKQPSVKFCFLSLGSEGRKEQLLRTDLDNALIYENPMEAQAKQAKEYFLRLGEEVIKVLVACGFESCPADMMASNPKWCQPVHQWEKYFQDWIAVPEPQAVMHTTIFFDFRPIYGDFELADRLKQFIFSEIDKKPTFLNFLAKNAMQNPPPLSFFRKFVVEKSGEHADQFDIKARSMMPLTDMARVLSLEHKLPIYGSTFERFEEVAQKEKNAASLLNSAKMSYEILMRFRGRQGLKNQDSGRYIHPEDFNKLERQTLRNIFKTIEKVQQILEVRYRLAYFN